MSNELVTPPEPQETEAFASSAQVIEALSHVFVREALGAFQLEDQHIFHEDIGTVISNALALIDKRQWSLGDSRKLT